MQQVALLENHNHRLEVFKIGPQYFDAITVDKTNGRTSKTTLRGRFAQQKVRKFVRERMRRMENYQLSFSYQFQQLHRLPEH